MKESAVQFVKDPGVLVEWAFKDRRLVGYPCSDNKVFNLCGFCHQVTLMTMHRRRVSALGAHTWFRLCRALTTMNHRLADSGSKQAIVHGFSEFHTGVQKMVEHADANLKTWELYDMETLPTWTSGHAVLLGDAAHPFQPCKIGAPCPLWDFSLMADCFKVMGQGGAMAIEDAVGIATLLPLGSRPEDIGARLEMYQSSRRPRVEMVLNFTRLNGRDDNDPGGERITRKFSRLFHGIIQTGDG